MNLRPDSLENDEMKMQLPNFVVDDDKLTGNIDDIIDSATGKFKSRSRMVLVIVIATCAMSSSAVGCLASYMMKFTAFYPTQKFRCVSNKCEELKTESLDSLEFYSRDYACSNMDYPADYTWDLDRTSFALEFGYLCKEYQLVLLDVFYFVGGTVGLLFGSFVFELVGRRKASLIGGCVCAFGTFLGFFCNSYGFMVAVRLLQGMGNFLSYSGAYIWILEVVPSKLRIYYNTWTMLLWTAGYPVLVGVCYFIHEWRYIHLALGSIFVLCYIPLLLLPDSPRYLLSIGKEEECRLALEKLYQLAGNPRSLDNVTIVGGNEENKTKEEEQSKNRLAAFWDNKWMLFETCVLSFLWITCSLLYFGLNFGWGKFGDTPYANYLFAGLGELIAYTGLMPLISVMGRRAGMSFLLASTCICFLAGIIPWQWTAIWGLERVMSLVAVVAISAAFGHIYMYTGELAPTSHRGLILCICSIIARLGAFIGPFVSHFSGHNSVKLGLNALLAGVAAALTLLLPETRGAGIPEGPTAILARREEQGLNRLPCTSEGSVAVDA